MAGEPEGDADMRSSSPPLPSSSALRFRVDMEGERTASRPGLAIKQVRQAGRPTVAGGRETVGQQMRRWCEAAVDDIHADGGRRAMKADGMWERSAFAGWRARTESSSRAWLSGGRVKAVVGGMLGVVRWVRRAGLVALCAERFAQASAERA